MRFDIDSFQEITDSLLRNKRRSLLTGFGIFWGLFMLLFLISGGNGLKELLAENFSGFASNSIVLGANATTKPYKGYKEGRYWDLEYKDIERLKQIFPEVAVITPQLSQWGASAEYGGHNTSCHVNGVDADFEKVETPQLKYGRFLNKIDIRQRRKVCVIGENIYNNLFPEGGDPCGQFVNINSVYYQVVGVDFSTSNINIQGNSSDAVTVPISILRDLLNCGNTVNIIYMVGKQGVRMSTLEPKVRQVIARAHFFDPKDESALFILNMEPIFKIIDTIFRGVNFLIWLIGIGTLLAGAIGVSNIMLVVVRERTVEIGIRRAIGATPKDILLQIILEGILLTLVAGLSSVTFTTIILNIIEVAIHHKAAFQIHFSTAIISFIILMILGLLAGIAPAYRAMKIKPVDAMRDE